MFLLSSILQINFYRLWEDFVLVQLYLVMYTLIFLCIQVLSICTLPHQLLKKWKILWEFTCLGERKQSHVIQISASYQIGKVLGFSHLLSGSNYTVYALYLYMFINLLPLHHDTKVLSYAWNNWSLNISYQICTLLALLVSLFLKGTLISCFFE